MMLIDITPIIEQGGNRLRLSPRQIKIAVLVAKGLPTKEIADRLDASRHTISTHLRLAFDLLNVNNRVEFVVLCMRAGLSDCEH